MRLLAIRSISCFLTLLPAAAAQRQVLKGMDVFGVAPGSVTELERCFGAAARDFVAASTARDRSRALELKEKLERQIKEAGGFAAAAIGTVHYPDPDLPVFLTFNLTLAGRKPPIELLAEPGQDVPDPDGLLASWREYDKIGNTIGFEVGQPEPSCPVYHCIHGFDHPKLRPFADLFARKVPASLGDLVRVLRTDKDAEDRAVAAFLLAHLSSARDVVEVLLPQVRDSNLSVRNNVMRVLASMADRGAGGAIPPEPILPFLRSQVGTDRNKAAAIIAGLAADKRHRKLLIGRAGCDLVRLLEMKQPNQNDWAHRALVKLHGKDLGLSDAAAWRQWLKTQRVTCQPEPEIRPGQLCPLSSPEPR